MICDVKGIPLYYEEYGEGRPLLCIHGYSVDHRAMSGCLEPFFRQSSECRRIYLDLPGMGKSPAPPWLKNADDMLDVLTAFIGEVIGDKDFLVIGQSYGGYLAQGLIHKMKHKVAGAFLLCPVIEADISKRTLPEHQVLYIEENFTATEEFIGMAVVANTPIYEAYKREMLTGLQAADKDFVTRYRKEGYAFSFHEALKGLRFDKPTTFLTGRQDAVTGYADVLGLLENYPRATFAVLDCAGHLLQTESNVLFALHVHDWLRRISYEK